MNKKIKVMHILLSLEIGGAERVATDLIKKLSGNGFTFSVCTLDKIGVLGHELGNDVALDCVNRKKGLDFALPMRLSRRIKSFSPDIIHMHNPTSILYGIIAAKLAGTAYTIATQHGKVLNQTRNMEFIAKGISRFLNKTIPVSEDVAAYLKKVHKIKGDRIETIINGIDDNLFKKDKEKRAAARSKLGITDEVVFGHVARLSFEKDQKTLIEAFNKVVSKEKKARLVIIGDGAERSRLEELTAKLKISDKVNFLGPKRDIPLFLNAFDVFVLSSLREGTSLTLLEAMATELPVVVTDVGGNSKVVAKDKTGILVVPQHPEEFSDAMLYLFRNPDTRQMMGRLGRERVVERFSLSKAAEKYAQIYKEIVAS